MNRKGHRLTIELEPVESWVCECGNWWANAEEGQLYGEGLIMCARLHDRHVRGLTPSIAP